MEVGEQARAPRDVDGLHSLAFGQQMRPQLGDLVSRCSLIALMYQSAHSAEHSFEEHVAIVDALEKRDARAAVRLMEEHLHNVERNLQLDPRMPDLESALFPRGPSPRGMQRREASASRSLPR